SEVALELFLDLRLRPGRRSIAFTETLAASPITPLDKAGSQIIASAIPTKQFLLFRLASRLLAGLPCGLGLVPRSSVRGRCGGVSDRLEFPSLGQFRGFHFLLISLSRIDSSGCSLWSAREASGFRSFPGVIPSEGGDWKANGTVIASTGVISE